MKRVKIRGFKAKKHTIPLDKKSLSKIKRKQRLWTRFLNTRDGEIYTEYCQVRIRLEISLEKSHDNTRNGLQPR
jgi:hypothetical protein